MNIPMQKIRGWRIWGLTLLVFLGLWSCDTDIEINAENLSVPIVYCVLDISDSVQYLKLNKTYLLEQAALEFPPHIDSTFFDGNIEIVLERWLNNKPVEFIPFWPTEEQPKDEGFFPGERNLVYRADTKVLPDTKYHLNIYIQNREKIVHAETISVGNLRVIDPLNLPQRKISLNTGVNYTTRWEPVNNAGIYQVIVKFKYHEVIDGNISPQFFEWPQSFTAPSTNVEYLDKDISGSRFFYVLAEQIPVKSGLTREVEGLDVVIISGGLELKYYIESTAPANGALMERPVYTNVENGIGIFSSVATKEIKGLVLASTTIDSIAYGQLTKELLFLDHKGLRDDDGS